MIAARLVDHQVGIERQLGPRAKVLDGLGPERQVRDEVAVHDVEVDPVGTGRLDPPDGVGKVREVRVEDARRDAGPTVGHATPPPRPVTGSWLRSPEQGRGALGLEPRASSGDGGSRRLAGSLRRRAGRMPRRPPGRGCGGSSSRCRPSAASSAKRSMTGIGLAVHGVCATGFIGIRLTWA